MDRKRHAVLGKVCLIFLLLFSLNACAQNKLAVSGNSTANSKNNSALVPQPQYLDFIDILVPSELEVNPSASFLFRTPELTSGVLALKGPVDPESLTTFFVSNMPKDHWKLISIFKSPKTLMLFRKDTRWCVINIFDDEYDTFVEIWVSPKNGDMASSLQK